MRPPDQQDDPPADDLDSLTALPDAWFTVDAVLPPIVHRGLMGSGSFE